MTSAPPKSDKKPPVEHEILFQNWFKSVGPRTYAAQLKKANNGNHFLVLTEGNRHKETGDIRKTRLFVYSEDFAAFFRMLHEAAVFIRENPVPEDVKRRQAKRWAKENAPRGTQADNRPPVNNMRDGKGADGAGYPRGDNGRHRPRVPQRASERPPERQSVPQSRPAPRPRPIAQSRPAPQRAAAMQPA